MEIIANAFYLPMTNYYTIEKAFRIYRYILGLDIKNEKDKNSIPK